MPGPGLREGCRLRLLPGVEGGHVDARDPVGVGLVERLALEFGAKGYAFLRMKEDQAIFTQLAFFEEGLDFERYWYSERVSDARAQASGLFQVPVVPAWHKVVGFGSRVLSPVET